MSSVIDRCTADIVILTEIWLSGKIADNKMCKYFYCFNRDFNAGGGVLIAILDSILSSVVPANIPSEIVCTVCTSGTKTFLRMILFSPSFTMF